MDSELVTLGPYRLFQSLKKGGMARVYLGVHVEDPHRVLAIKTLLPELAGKSNYRDMFTTEGKVGRLLEHHHIVATLDAGRAGDTHFIVMEYLQGFDLSTLLRQLRKQGHTMPLGVALTLACAMAEGLAHAHDLTDEHGRPLDIVNRDVSPGNVMITTTGRGVLIDFGIAQTTVDVRSQIGSIKGKISHMSPEQVRGLPVDQRSDVFSLGTVLYQMLTGVNVFQDDGDFATMERVRRAEAPPPSHHQPALHGALDDLVMATLTPRAMDRTPSARALLDALRGYMRDHQIAEDEAAVATCLRQTLGPRLEELQSTVAAHHQGALEQLGVMAPRQTLQEAMPPPEVGELAPPPPSKSPLLWVVAAGVILAVVTGVIIFNV
ncbi:MAG: serine/threonine protein kinase [Bradymonadia bacterium]